MVTHEDFKILKCDNCQLLITHPTPADLSKYYQSSEYLSHHSESRNLISLLYTKVRNIQLDYKLSLIREFSQGVNLLDFGCGTGYFLRHTIQNGYKSSGLEIDDDARNFAAAAVGSSIYSDPQQIPHDAVYDIITLWHVLEHLADPISMLNFFESHLSSTGTLFLALPNFKSRDAQHYSAYWAGYDVPRHLFHFSRSSINILAKATGFKVIATKPLKFDAFYVSLLSEQYEGSTLMKYPLAFIRGLLSNYHARKTGEYSSLVYILQKAHA